MEKLWRFDTITERDGQMDGRTDRISTLCPKKVVHQTHGDNFVSF